MCDVGRWDDQRAISQHLGRQCLTTGAENIAEGLRAAMDLGQPLRQSAKGTSRHSKKSPTGPTEWTPKLEYLIALVPYLGVRW